MVGTRKIFMKFHYDKSIDALALRFSEKGYIESDEIRPGIIFDYNKAGKVVGIEILEASKILSKKEFQFVNSKKSIPLVVS